MTLTGVAALPSRDGISAGQSDLAQREACEVAICSSS